jgi:predicted nucleotidyltransferase
MNEDNLRNLETVASGLGEILGQVVFVGGATVELYATTAGAPPARPTIDVDCISEISSYGAYSVLEEALRRKGFRNDQSKGAPLCRWVYEDIALDVMPTDIDALGFSNDWYAEGIHHTVEVNLPRGPQVKILQAPYFLATKLAALKTRSKDLRTSGDFEDVVYILRNRDSVSNEINGAEDTVKRYLSKTFQELLARDDIDEAIVSVLDFGEPEGSSRLVRTVMETIGRFANKGEGSGQTGV